MIPVALVLLIALAIALTLAAHRWHILSQVLAVMAAHLMAWSDWAMMRHELSYYARRERRRLAVEYRRLAMEGRG